MTHDTAADLPERPAMAPSAEVVDVAALLTTNPTGDRVVLWSGSNQLQANVVSLRAGQGIDAHAEPDLDVTVAVLAGSMELRQGADLTLADVTSVHAPAVIVLPAGTRRSLRAGAGGVAYLTAHRRRIGMLPTVR